MSAACSRVGRGLPLSTTTSARLQAQWCDEWQTWMSRPLTNLDVVYLGVDRIYRKASLEQERAWVLAVSTGVSGGRKELIVPVPGY